MEIKGVYTVMEIPVWYELCAREILDRITNGCGPGGWLGDLFLEKAIPDMPFGIDFTPACIIHDGDYYYARSMEDITAANTRFKKNLYEIIDYEFPEEWQGWVRRLAYIVADVYYEAVDEFGLLFWKNKGEKS